MDEITTNGKIYTDLGVVAGRTGYDREYLRKLAKRGAVDAVQAGETWFIDQEDLQRYRDERPQRKPHRK